MSYEDYGDNLKCKMANKVAKEIAPPVSRELIKFSDAALERSYKVSYELAEVTLPPRISKELTRDLRLSTNRLKKSNADNLNAAAVEIVSSSTKTIFDFATGEKNFDEAIHAIAAQTKVVVKKVVVEKGKEIAIQEAKRIGGNAAQKVLLNVGINSNVAAKALVFGSMIKDNVLDLLDGKIDEEQFIKEVGKKGLTLAIETVGGFVGAEIGATYGAVIGQTLIPIPVVGAVIGSTVTAVACSGLIAAIDATLKLWDASKINAAADRRKIIYKIKTDALAEMEHQRGVMKKYFADEKYKWDKNVQDGFELISKGTHSNDVEIIAQGLDKILQNFGSKVAFANREDFRRDFRSRKIVVNL
ncbi:MAG: hypothetical protein IJK81_05540 [Selenomonadaceae bacterium]|nr:hypothetical protein [Selenomonadaceae bacterium]